MTSAAPFLPSRDTGWGIEKCSVRYSQSQPALLPRTLLSLRRGVCQKSPLQQLLCLQQQLPCNDVSHTSGKAGAHQGCDSAEL